jgi:hypothetical protein
MRVYRARCVFCAHDGLRVPKAYVQMCVCVSCTNIGWRVFVSGLLAVLVVQCCSDRLPAGLAARCKDESR